MGTEHERSKERGSETITVAEAARRLGCRECAIKEWYRAGKVDWVIYIEPVGDKAYGRWLVKREAFERWLGYGPPPVRQEIIISTPEAFEMLKRAVITNV